MQTRSSSCLKAAHKYTREIQQRRLCSIGLKSKRFYESVSDAQRLRPLSPDARAAWPRKQFLVWCGTCASRMFHTTQEIRRAPQARASERDGNQTDSERVKR